MNYILHILIMIGIYLMVAYSLNLIVGFSGLLTLCHAAFYGIGAYVFTLTTIHWGLSFIPALLISIIITAFFAFIVGIPALKFRGDTFVIVTLGFQMIIFTILYNWVSLTKGPYGIPGIPRPYISISIFRSQFNANRFPFSIVIDSMGEYLLLILILDVIFLTLLFILYKSPFGLVLKGLRDDERAGEALGKSAFRNFLYSFTIGSAFVAIPGALYASYVTYIDPTSFTLEESIFQVTVLLLGGSGNIKGPFVGVLFMLILPELLRFLGLSDTIAPNVRQIIYGALLVLLMFTRPRGIAGELEVK